MELQSLKRIVSAFWVVLTLAIAIAAQVTGPIQILIAALGVLPPLALLLWWNEPAQTTAEAIDEVRRGR